MTFENQHVEEFGKQISRAGWSDGGRAVRHLTDLERMKLVRSLIEKAFVIAAHTDGIEGVLLSLACVPHDSSLDHAIKMKEENNSSDTYAKHVAIESSMSRFV